MGVEQSQDHEELHLGQEEERADGGGLSGWESLE